MTDTLESALAWHAAGCSVVPVVGDGSKRPAISWKEFQDHRADTDTIAYWFDTSHRGPAGPDGWGIGVVCGAISGQLEMLEFEGRAVTEGLPARMRQAMDDHGQADLWAALIGGYMETTPSGGLHLLYRVTDGQARPNTKLARRPGPDRTVEVLVETRGEGGYTVVAPTGGHCHPTGRAWTTITGSPATIPAITAEQRDTLHAIATLLDAMPVHQGDNGANDIHANVTPGYAPGSRPGDDYNTRASWDDLLGGRGWTRMWRLGDGWGWRRPGKTDRSISATTGTSSDGVDRLYVFSTSVDLPTETPITKFAYYALTEHHGDYTAAAKALAGQGYGQPPTQQRPPVQISGPASAPPRRLAAVPDPPVDGTAALAPAPDIRTIRHSDDGNASALIDLHGHRIRYCPDRGRWLTWDGTRWCWEASGGGQVRELAKDTAHRMPDAKGADEWRKRSLSAVGTTNTLTQASTDTRVTVALADLDADPWALNTPAGVVNLRTGQLQPADPAALHTRSTAVVPDLHADDTAWQAFLATTFGGDQELIGYLQRLVGYSATGYIGPHVLPFAHGSGGNGKGVFLEAVQAVLGDYATTAPNAFLMARTYSQHETEIARLAGARMVLCSEVNETDRFDEAKVKQLTGGDTLTARFMRQDHFTFAPTHHLWLMGNYRPTVTSGGRSFWRRCRLIPFPHEVPDEQRIDDLQGILVRDHGPAILAWIIRGAAEFADGGLREPASVTEATAEYAHDQDTVGRFVDDMCHRGPAAGGVRVNTRELTTAYERWCTDAGELPVTAKRLGIELRQRFDITVERSNGKRFYAGISLLADEKDDDGSVTGDREEWFKR